MSRSRTTLGDDGPLCCCEYKNQDGETAHILSCCCDCSALDEAADRCVRCAPVSTSSCDAIMATIADRARVPWIGGSGAVQLQCDVTLPILILPTLFVLATAHELLTIAVCLATPGALLLYYCLWRRRGPRRSRTRFFYAWSLVSTFTCFYVFSVSAFAFREVLLWEMLIVFTLFGVMLYVLYLIKCDPGTLRPVQSVGIGEPKSVAMGHDSTDRSEATMAETRLLASGASGGLNPVKRTRAVSECLSEADVTWVDSRPLKDGVLRTYCDKCHLVQPRRANHCQVCQQCIEERDHHCIWLDQCIGRRNHRAFIAAMVLFVVNGTYATHLMLTTMCTPEMYYDWFLVPKDCRFVYSDFLSAVTFVSCCYSLTAIGLVTAVLLQQLVLISQNVTLQEFNAASRRGWVRWMVVVMNNANNRGFGQNWLDFLSSRRKYHHHRPAAADYHSGLDSHGNTFNFEAGQTSR